MYTSIARGDSGTGEDAFEIVLADTAVITAILEQEKRQSGSDHLVLVPIGMVLEEAAHAVKQHLRHLGLKADHGPPQGSPRGMAAGRCPWGALPERTQAG